MSYRFYNANVRGNFVNDCTIRAISLAEGKSWNETYEELSDLAQYNGIILDDVRFIEPLLDSRYDRVDYDGYYVGDFVEDHPEGTYLLTMSGHISCCVSGILFDTFDCRDRVLWSAWRVE